VIGSATLSTDGVDVYADIDIPEADIDGLYPALGGRSAAPATDKQLHEFMPYELSLCDSENADTRIAPIRQKP
jgi:hypothetical protein